VSLSRFEMTCAELYTYRSYIGLIAVNGKSILTSMERSQYINWTEVNLSALQNNIKVIERLSKKPMMAVVKANAYGHGQVEVAQAASAAGIQWFGVARLEEAVKLRQGGIDRNILVLGYTPPASILIAQAKKIDLCLYDIDTAKAYEAQASATGKPISVQVKIDTGMGRLGVFPEDGVEFIRALQNFHGLRINGIFTHFARADEPAEPATSLQINRFDRLVQELEKSGLRPALVHASNSGATIAFPQAEYDLLRPGIIMYGLSPSSQIQLPEGILPVLTWKTRLTSVKILPTGHGVSYGHEYVTSQNERVGALAVGYADGYRRSQGNIVLIQGKRVPVIGRVCMDQTMVSLQGLTDCRIGDEVVLMGCQGQECITADEIARHWGTINYEVIAGIAARVNRHYLYHD
jgi:alanine racemase